MPPPRQWPVPACGSSSAAAARLTDAGGRFILAAIPAGTFTLRVTSGVTTAGPHRDRARRRPLNDCDVQLP